MWYNVYVGIYNIHISIYSVDRSIDDNGIKLLKI